jgi:hypothetical protein
MGLSDIASGGSILWNLDLNSTQFTSGLAKARGEVTGLGTSMETSGSKIGTVLGTLAKGVLVAGVAITALSVASVKEFSEEQKNIAQTNAVLASTGGVAGVTAEMVTQLSESWQQNSRYSHDAVRQMENVLLTFPKITKDTFPQATGAVLDLSTALHEDLQSSAIRVGKALQDPILGMTALRRVGINFNAADKETVTQLVKSGHQLEAQKFILRELNTEFGGSAKAASETFGGALIRVKNNLKEGMEAFGGYIVNGLQPLATSAANTLAKIDWTKVIDSTVKSIKEFYNQLANFLGPSFVTLWHTLNEKVFPILNRLWHEVIEPLGKVLGETFVVAVKLSIDALNLFLTVLTPVINWMLDHKNIVIDFATAFGILALALKFNDIKDAFLLNMSQIMGSIAGAKGAVVDLFNKIGGSTVMGGIVTAGAMADIALVAQAVQSVLGALNAMNQEKASIAGARASNQQLLGQMRGLLLSSNPSQRNSAQAWINNLYAGKYGPYAKGTDFAPGGLALVGEQGPELVNLPRGSQVIPNNKLGKTGATINQYNNIYNQVDLDRVTRHLAWSIR